MKNLAKDHPKIGSMVKIFPTVYICCNESLAATASVCNASKSQEYIVHVGPNSQ